MHYIYVVAAFLFMNMMLHSQPNIIKSIQPKQMQSSIKIDNNLFDAFFTSEESSYPWWVVKSSDNRLMSVDSGKSVDNIKKSNTRLNVILIFL